jgi:hypothetical protein
MSNVYRFAYPSKSMTYWSTGCPVLALIEPNSELAETIQSHKLGYVASSRSVTEIAEAIVKAAAESRSWTVERRWQIERTCTSLFGINRMLSKWDVLLRNLADVDGTSPAENCRTSNQDGSNDVRMKPAA